jgi:TonB family protein
MKRITVIFACLLIAGPIAGAEYSERVKFAIEQLRTSKNAAGVPKLDGCASGAGSRHGAFYLLYPYFFSQATREDVALMLKDSNPLVRILGARRILNPFLRPQPLESIDFLAKDTVKVEVGPLYESREHYQIMTVAEVVEKMKKDPEFLFKRYNGETVQLGYILEAQPLRSLRAIDLPLPAFPPDELQAGIGGNVTLRFVVKDDCSIADVSVIQSSLREFEGAAKEAVSHWRFSRADEDTEKKHPPAVLECQFVFGFKGD